jgi:hypothetical protein
MRQKTLRLILACLLVAGFAVTASALDTSPYLASDFYTDTYELDAYTSFFIVNPTPVPLRVLAAFYNEDGVFSTCVSNMLTGNTTWNVDVRNIPVPDYGTAKFFAFPANTMKFDPNAVIGGFKQEIDCDYVMTGAYTYTDGPLITETVQVGYEYSWIDRVREANIKAVTINSATIGEFADILKRVCPQYNGSYIRPKDYCEALPLYVN